MPSGCNAKKHRINYVFKLTIVKPYWKRFFYLTTFFCSEKSPQRSCDVQINICSGNPSIVSSKCLW